MIPDPITTILSTLSLEELYELRLQLPRTGGVEELKTGLQSIVDGDYPEPVRHAALNQIRLTESLESLNVRRFGVFTHTTERRDEAET